MGKSEWTLVLTVMLLVFALFDFSAHARSAWDDYNTVTDTSGTDKLPPVVRVKRDVIKNPIVPPESPKRVALGATVRSDDKGVPYNVVDMTYDDLLYFNAGGFQVVQDETVTRKIHFAYQNLDDPSDNRQMGYQIYDPSAGSGSTFPQGTDGCIVQPGADYGRNPKIDVFPNGRPILAGFDSASGDVDFHAYWDLTGNCLWGAGSQFDPASYNNLPGMIQSENQLIVPIVRVQDVGGTKYTHVATTASGNGSWGPNTGVHPIVYYRKAGNPPAGNWQDGVVIDLTTIYYSFNMAASRVSDNVVVTYCKPTAAGLQHLNGFYDEDVWYRESSDGGATWNPPVNMTRYSRTDTSYTAWVECNPMYDSDDNLHIIWNAVPTPADPYGDGNMDWAYSWNCYYMHWRRLAFSGDTNTSIFHDANWPDGGQGVYGLGGSGNMAASNATIGECAGRLYIVFSMANDMSVDPPLLNDCMSDNVDRFHSGMHDLYMVVSSDLTGDAWDAYRNITHTYSPRVWNQSSPGCDSATGNGVCYDEKNPSLFEMGVDVSEHPYNDVDSVLTAFYDPLEWYDPNQVPTQGVWTNDSALHLLYINDHWGGYVSSGRGIHTLNEVAWLRVGCVDPVVGPRITVNPTKFSWPDYVPNGVQIAFRVAVFNSGNAPLSITLIEPVEFTGSVPGWLDVSAASLPVIPPQGTGFFEVFLNKNGVIDNGLGNAEVADGQIRITSNAINAGIFLIDIEMLVADFVLKLKRDSVSTDPNMFDKFTGDDIALIVSSDGSMGNNGNDDCGATMDFLHSNEYNPDEATTYMCSGAPFLLQNEGGEISIATTLHSVGMSRENSFVPIWRSLESDFYHGTSDWCDSICAGEITNWDSTLIVSRKYFAPRDQPLDPAFIIVETMLYTADEQEGDIPHLSLGTVIDWDVPSQRGSQDNSLADNTTGISMEGQYVYVRGTDSAGFPGPMSWSNTERFACEVFLCGYMVEPGKEKDDVFRDPRSVFATPFHTWWDSALAASPEDFWDTLAANTGYSAPQVRDDLAVFLNVLHDFTLRAEDTLYYYTAMVTQLQGDIQSLDETVTHAKAWASDYICLNCDTSCCIGQRGDIDLEPNCSPEEQVADIGDLTNLISHLFITFAPICCEQEADIAPTPVTDGVVDIGDLTGYINYLFITFVPPIGC